MRFQSLGSLKESASGSSDLVWAAAGEILAIALLLVAPNIVWLMPAKAAIAALAAIVFPGYVITGAILPNRLGTLERLVISPGVGILNAVALALILSTLPWGLGRLQWMAALIIVTIGASLVASREGGQRVTPRSFVAGVRRGSSLTTGLLALAVAITIVAIALRVGQGPPHGPGFTQLWALPATTSGTPMVEVGARNAELGSTKYRLEILVAGDIRRIFRFALAPGEEWSRVVTLKASGREKRHIEVLLYRPQVGPAPYREVDVRISSVAAD
ncbi:MAG: DUF1616 domain-containing protein [Nocardioidaceae bacterium]